MSVMYLTQVTDWRLPYSLPVSPFLSLPFSFFISSSNSVFLRPVSDKALTHRLALSKCQKRSVCIEWIGLVQCMPPLVLGVYCFLPKEDWLNWYAFCKKSTTIYISVVRDTTYVTNGSWGSWALFLILVGPRIAVGVRRSDHTKPDEKQKKEGTLEINYWEM